MTPIEEKEKLAAERFARFVETFISDARNNTVAGEADMQFLDVPLQEAAALLRHCQETRALPQLQRLFIDFLGYMVQEGLIEPFGNKPVVTQ